MINYIVGGIIVVLIILAVRSFFKKDDGECSGCSGCSKNCGLRK
ncbi:MAG: FeoB-associated Cys-rich membrane protein [Negativicutes bacterium]|nr:FeoB-associated Cys-rich membrane protein [Negativicutes bacterium]